MKKVSLPEARNNLRAPIRGLAVGSSVLIVDRGRPVARLEPVATKSGEQCGRLARLVHAGIVRPRIGGPPLSLFSTLPSPAHRSVVRRRPPIEERRKER